LIYLGKTARIVFSKAMSSSTNAPEDAPGTSVEIAGAVDSYLKKEIARYSMVAAFALSAIGGGGAFLFKTLIENKLSELEEARKDISREVGRVEAQAKNVEAKMASISDSESKVRQTADKVEELEKRLRMTIDEALDRMKTLHDEGTGHVASLKKKAEDAQLITRRLEERVKQLEANVEQTVQALQQKAGEISGAAQAVEVQMAQQKKQRMDDLEARRTALLKTEGLPGSPHRVVYSKDPKGVSVYLSPTNHVSGDAVGTVKFAETGEAQFIRLDVPEQSNDGTPQARVRFSGWVESPVVEGADLPAIQDNPAQVQLSVLKGATLHQDASADSPELLEFKPGKTLPAIVTGETKANWIHIVIDAWMPVRFNKSINKILIAPVKDVGG
jgi:HAMP domain-containing protein